MIMWLQKDMQGLNKALDGFRSGRDVAFNFYECEIIVLMNHILEKYKE